jgi:hypothetical protein
MESAVRPYHWSQRSQPIAAWGFVAGFHLQLSGISSPAMIYFKGVHFPQEITLRLAQDVIETHAGASPHRHAVIRRTLCGAYSV